MSDTPFETEEHIDRLYLRYKDNWLGRVKGSPRWYRHRYCPVKQEIIRNTLATKLVGEAWDRLIAQVDAGDPKMPDILPDPRIIDVLDLYVLDPKRARSWKNKLSTIREILSAHLPNTTISTFKIEAQSVLLKQLSKSMNTASIQLKMRLIRAATRWICTGDVFEPRRCPLDPPPIVMTPSDIRRITKGGPIRARNQHPSREHMATFLQAIVETGREDLRRFVILSLATAGRPGAVGEIKSNQLTLEQGLLQLLREGDEQSENKIKATVPLPISVLNEIASWEPHADGRYVGIQPHACGAYMREMGGALSIPHLIPSAIRDFMATQMRSAGGRFNIAPVPKEQIKRWMGHKDGGVHEEYGLFEREASHQAVIAVEEILNELDRMSQGAIYRSKKTVWALPPNLRQNKEDCAEETPVTGRITAKSALTELPWSVANLNGRKVGMTAVIEGYQGRFREISAQDWPDFEDGKFDDSPGYLLNHLYRWFELVGVDIFDQDPTTVVDGFPIRIFTDRNDGRVLPAEVVCGWMVAELQRDPGGWRDSIPALLDKPYISRSGPYEELYENLATLAFTERREKQARERHNQSARAKRAREKASQTTIDITLDQGISLAT